ncbi:MAG TPA: GldG family protein, partial [Opitutaceae bacterium]
MIDSFRAARWIRTLNLVLQAILFMTLIGGLNFLAGSHAWRFDLTRYRRYSLSAETLSYLRELSRPVTIVVSNGQSEDPMVKGLLSEYVNATESNPSGQIKVDTVDIYQDRRKTEKYGIEQAGVLLVLCGDKRRAINVDSEMYRVEDKVKKEFTGEQAVTAAILDVSNPEKKKIYFLVGHAELRPDNVDPAQGLSLVRDQLRLRNYDVDTIELAAARKVPADASLLVSVSPVDAFSPFEQELLRQYLGAGAGRLILFLATNTQPGLTDLLLDDWGIIVDDDIVFDLGSDNLSEEGDLIIRAFAKHPITQTMLDYKEPLRIGFARTVRPLPGRPAASGLTVVTLAATSTTAWGE